MTWKVGDSRFSGLKVLVVDDDQHTRKLTRALLTIIGVREISEAANGCTALEKVEAQLPDIVILDRRMPILDGIEFMRIVRAPDAFPYSTLSVIMLSGDGEKGKIIEAMEAGVNEFLLKPISIQHLADRINAIVHKPRPFIREKNYFGPARRLVKLNDYAADSFAYLE